MNRLRRRLQKGRRRAEKREARIVAGHRHHVLDVLNKRWPPEDGRVRIVAVVPQGSGLGESLADAADVFYDMPGARVVGETIVPIRTTTHSADVLLRFEASGNFWRVTIVKNRHGRTGITAIVGLSAEGRWELR